MRKGILPLFAIICLSLSACSTFKGYSPAVQQGNIISQRMINQLKLGMSKRQVTAVLETSLLTNVFNSDRWVYVYSFEPHGGKRLVKRLNLYFDGNKLARITGDYKLGIPNNYLPKPLHHHI